MNGRQVCSGNLHTAVVEYARRAVARCRSIDERAVVSVIAPIVNRIENFHSMYDESQFQRKLRRGVKHLHAVDPRLSTWMRQHGPCDLQVHWQRSVYESLVRAVAHQQLHGKAAATILRRLEDSFRGHAFPTPRQLARAPVT